MKIRQTEYILISRNYKVKKLWKVGKGTHDMLSKRLIQGILEKQIEQIIVMCMIGPKYN